MSVDLNQPFLESVLQQDLQQNKSESKGKGAKVKARKSKVRQSWEEPGYRRKWARSSTAWSSHNTGELNTSASLRLVYFCSRKQHCRPFNVSTTGFTFCKNF